MPWVKLEELEVHEWISLARMGVDKTCSNEKLTRIMLKSNGSGNGLVRAGPYDGPLVVAHEIKALHCFTDGCYCTM